MNATQFLHPCQFCPWRHYANLVKKVFVAINNTFLVKKNQKVIVDTNKKHFLTVTAKLYFQPLVVHNIDFLVKKVFVAINNTFFV